MEEYRCPVAATNREAHAKFIQIFGGLRERFEREGATLALVLEAQREVTGWVTNHIVRVDTHLRTCVASTPGA